MTYSKVCKVHEVRERGREAITTNIGTRLRLTKRRIGQIYYVKSPNVRGKNLTL